MIDISTIDYSALDRPEILMYLFHPRPDWGEPSPDSSAEDTLIPVGDDAAIGARFHLTGESSPNILFFHGNGEIVSDYDDMAPLYNRMDINFLPVDYRGYGKSTGNPTITNMMRDCHVIFDFVDKWLKEKGYTGPRIVMGRSLGSASALELSFHYKDQLEGLIVESGFASLDPLLQLLGINTRSLGLKGGSYLQNAEKIRSFDKQTLIIHAEKDHIIPFSAGQELFDACKSADKTFFEDPRCKPQRHLYARNIRIYGCCKRIDK